MASSRIGQASPARFDDTHSVFGKFSTIAPLTTALVVVDVQIAFVDPAQITAVPGIERILPNVNRLIAAFRAVGSPVIFLRHTVSDDGPQALAPWQAEHPFSILVKPLLLADAPQHGLAPDLDVALGDIIVDKYRPSAFIQFSSDLQRILANGGIEMIVIAGCVTNLCCESTARDGNMLGYKIIVVDDAMAARTRPEHDAALLNLASCFADVRQTAEVLELIAVGATPSRSASASQ